MSAFWLWLIVAGAFALAEILTLALFAAFLALAALGAALAAILGLSALVQAIVFGIVGVGGILVARPLLLPWVRKRPWPVFVSGAEGMIGQQANLTEPIVGRDQPGHVRIAGESWPALTVDGTPLPANTLVRVTALRSATLVVEALPQPKSRTI
jgi:membrane protein implicated in regulation of membrane protease activity